jgi:hypothetical protein
MKESIKTLPELKHINEAKYYLYNNILKALRQYRADKTIEMQLHERFMNIDVLIQKGLFPLALVELDKAESMIKKYEKLEFLNTFYFYKNRLTLTTNFTYTDAKKLEHFISEKKVSLEYLQALETIKSNIIKLVYIRRHLGLPKDNAVKKEYKKLAQFANINYDHTQHFIVIFAQLEFDILFNNYYYNDQAKNNEYCKKAYQLMQNHLDMVVANPYLKSSILHNYCLSETNLRNEKNALSLLDEMKNYALTLQSDEDNYYKAMRSFLSISSYVFNVFANRTEATAQADFVMYYAHKLTKLDTTMLCLLHGNCAQIYLTQGEAKKCIALAQYVIENEQKTNRQMITDSYLHLCLASILLRNTKQALEYLKQLMMYKNEIVQPSSIKIFEFIEVYLSLKPDSKSDYIREFLDTNVEEKESGAFCIHTWLRRYLLKP